MMAEWEKILLGIESESSSALARAMGYKSLSAHTTVIRSARVQNDPKPVTSPIGSFGSVEHANTAQRLANDRIRDVVIPGWRFLGQGHTRWAYLGPDNHVYKVQTARGAMGANMRELNIYKETAHRMPAGVRLAHTAFLTDRVNVMEYWGGRNTSLPYTLIAACKTIGICDITYDANVRRDGTDYILIDYASC